MRAGGEPGWGEGPRLASVLLLLLLAGCLSPSPPPPERVQSAPPVAYLSAPDGAQVAVALPAMLRPLHFTATATGHAGAEPTIGVAPDGTVLVAAYETILRSGDGVDWHVAHKAAVGQSFDPMLTVDAVTGRASYLHIFPERRCATMSTSPDSGRTWTEHPVLCPSVSVDHPKLASGPARGLLGAGGGRVLSLCYNDQLQTVCASSRDGGLTFLPAVPVDGFGSRLPLVGGAASGVTGDCGGLNGNQLFAPDGTLFVPYGFACQESRIAVSTDGGLSFTRQAPQERELEIDPEVAVTPDGTAYYLYRGADQRMHLLRSHDRFATVEGPFTVSPPPIRGTAFAAMVAGADGRLALAYLGTNGTAGEGPDDAPPTAAWRLYAAVSLDAGAPSPTFATVEVTPDPVQRGSICIAKPCRDGNRNLLDFIDMALGPDGRAWIAYSDGCTSGACRAGGQTDVHTSRDDALWVAVLDGGSRLS